MSEWENNVRTVIPYTPGEQPKKKDIIKLNTNENPFPPSPKVREAIESFRYTDLRLYPDPNASELVEAVAAEYKVKQSQVFVGIGSDDVLSTAFMTFFNSDKPILFPDITYSFYDVWAELHQIPTLLSRLMMTFGSVNPGSVVIVDEAYIDFGGKSCLPLIDKYDNLLVVQTCSKSRSMAGIRIGFAIGSEKLIKYMNDVRFSINSYTMSGLTVACGKAAIQDSAYYKANCEKIIRTREFATHALDRLGFSFPESQANFLFVKHRTVSAKRIFEELKNKGIYVRYWDKPRIDNYLRITIGTSTDMRKLYDTLAQILNISEVKL